MSVLDDVYGDPLDAVYGEKPSALWNAANLIPAVALARLTKPARTMASEAFKVSRADKSAGLREGLIPWTPDIVGEFPILGTDLEFKPLDVRLAESAEEIASRVDEGMRERVQTQLSEGKLWPTQEGQPWYKIDPALVPDAINTWAASAGDQVATLFQQVVGKVIGGIGGRVVGAAIGGAGGAPAGGVGAAPGAVAGGTVGGKIGGHIGGAIPNIANETAGYMHDAEFWGISDRRIMEENARYYGLASGLMEYAQNAVELAATKGMLKLPAKEAAKRSIVVQGLKELGINAGEGLTEVSQDALERFFLRRAAEQMKARDPNFKMPDIPDTFSGWKRTFAQAAGTSAIMRGAGTAGSRAMQHLYGQEQVQADQAAENPLMEEPQAPEYGAQPQVMPEADVEDMGNEQLQAEGEAILTEQEQKDLDQLESEEEVTDDSGMESDPAQAKMLSSLVLGPLARLDSVAGTLRAVLQRAVGTRRGRDRGGVWYDWMYSKDQPSMYLRRRSSTEAADATRSMSDMSPEDFDSPYGVGGHTLHEVEAEFANPLFVEVGKPGDSEEDYPGLLADALGVEWEEANVVDFALGPEERLSNMERRSTAALRKLGHDVAIFVTPVKHRGEQVYLPVQVFDVRDNARDIGYTEEQKAYGDAESVELDETVTNTRAISTLDPAEIEQLVSLGYTTEEIESMSTLSARFNIEVKRSAEDRRESMRRIDEEVDADLRRLSAAYNATEQEQKDLDQLESEEETVAQVEQGEEERMIVGGGEKGVPSGPVKPKLYIGNVTPRAKNAWVEILNKAREKEQQHGEDVTREDLGQHTEGGFRTKRAEIELTVDEARDLEERLTDAIDERLAEEKSFDSHELALLKAVWGDVKELRQALGLPVGRMPFKVIHAGKTRIAVIPSTTERIYTAIEGPNKGTLADLSPADLVTQEQALNAALKKAAAAAKHAFSVGGKEAAAKLREHVRELKRKARAIKLAKNARKTLIRQLTRKVSDSMEPAYRRAVRAIVDRVDPRNRTKDMQTWIDKAQADYQANPDLFQRTRPQADQRLLQRGQQVPVNRMSTRQLEALVDERRRLEKEGRGVAEREKRQRDVREAGFVQDGIDALQSVRERGRLAPGQDTDNATWFERMKDRIRDGKGEAGFGSYRLDRMFEYLDGFQRGFYTHIWEKVKGDLHTSRERRAIRAREFVRAMKDLGINGAEWLLETRPFRKSNGTIHNLTTWQMLGAYIQSHHATGKGHLIHGNQFSERDLKEIAKLVEADPKLTAMHQWIVQRQQEQWKALTERLRAVGIDPTQFTEIKEYLPLMIADMDMVQQDDVLQKFLGHFVPQELMPKGFLKERKEGAGQPIELDAMTLYMHSIDQVEHMMAMAPILSRLSRMLQNQGFRQALNDKTYGKGAEMWTQWLMDIGRDRVVREQKWYDKVVGYLQRNSVLYAIGWNLPSVLKQIPALFVGFAEDPRMVTFLVDNMMALSSQERFNEFRDEARRRSSVLRHRNIEPELRAMWNKPRLQAMMKREFGKGGFELDQSATSWMRAMDDWLTTLAWKCRYDAALSEGYDEKAAIRLADQAVQKTQQMASPEDLPHLFRDGTFASVLNLFQNQGNQELNYWVHDIYGKAKHGRLTPSQVAWRAMMATILPIAVFNVVSHGGGRDEDEETTPFAVRVGGYMFGNLPLIGNIVSAIVNGYGGGVDLWEMPLEGIQQTVSGIKHGDVRTAAKGVAKVVAGAAPTKGLISGQAVRTIEGAYDLATGETEDKRRLVWSKAMLEEESKGGGSARRGGIR